MSVVVRYLLAVVAIASTFVVKVWLLPLTGTGAPFVLFFAAVLAVSFYLGTGPGIFAVLMSLPFAAYVFVVRAGYPVYQAVFQSLLFLTDGLVVVYLTARIRRGRQALHDVAELARESEERFRLSIDEAPIGMALVALDGHFVRVNRAFCEIVGYSPAELAALTFQAITAPDDLDPDLEGRARLARGEIPRLQLEKRYLRKDGTPVDVLLSASVLRNQEGAPLYYITQIEDITAQKRARDSLQDSERELRTLAEAMPQIVWMTTPDGSNTWLNQQWVSYTGLTHEESHGHGWIKPFHPDDRQRTWDAWRRAVETDGVYSLESRLRGADGSYRWWLIRGVSMHDQDGKVVSWLGTCTDVEDIKRTEQALRRSEEALRRAVTARDQVLGVVAHDLRNPLATILMQSSALKRRGPEPERRNQRAREIISRAASRMNHLIRDLLDVAQVEAGQLKIERGRVPAGELAAEAVEMQSSLASSSGLEMRLEVAHDVHEVFGDRERLHQVLDNLIGNAIKFTRAGGRITVGAAAREAEVVFWVADTGCGISPDSLPHVFDRFWQVTQGSNRLGAGLGLAITKGIVEAHGGRIWVESTAGQGSTFFFTIAKATAPEDRPPASLH
jgi:PAS domain S-box-containing protein